MHFSSTTIQGLLTGPKLIILGGVHGNEVCGPIAIRRVLDELASGALSIQAGLVTFVPVTNPKAYAQSERNGDRNLNRDLRVRDNPREFEDHIGNWLCPLLARHEVLIDLHSTRARNPAFAMLGPEDNDGPLEPFQHAVAERALAKRLGVGRFVEGWLSTYARGVARRRAAGRFAANGNDDPRYGVGTTEYMRSQGGYAITLECGQHDDPASPEVAYRAIHNALAALGLSGEPAPDAVAHSEHLRMYEVFDRDHADDAFSREWFSFSPIEAGGLIATRATGEELRPPRDGYLMFPDASAKPGNEWFYLASRDAVTPP